MFSQTNAIHSNQFKEFAQVYTAVQNRGSKYAINQAKNLQLQPFFSKIRPLYSHQKITFLA